MAVTAKLAELFTKTKTIRKGRTAKMVKLGGKIARVAELAKLAKQDKMATMVKLAKMDRMA